MATKSHALSAKEQNAIRFSIEKLCRGITGKKIAVKPTSGDTIACTDGSTVFINFGHPFIVPLEKAAKISAIRGLAAHEVMHILLSDFQAIRDNKYRSASNFEEKTFLMLNNIIEDEYIENMAPDYLGDGLIRDLDMIRAVTYGNSEPISDCVSPFSQYVCAAIQYGDAGLIKGEWTFPEARTVFVDTLGLMEQALTEINPYSRVKIAEELVEKTRPLWQEEADLDELFRKLLEDAEKICGKSAEDLTNSEKGGGISGTPMESPESAKVRDSAKTKRRKITCKIVSREEYEEAKKNASEGSDSGDGDLTVLIPEDGFKKEDFEEPSSGSSSGGASMPMPMPEGKSDGKAESSPGGSSKCDEDAPSESSTGGSAKHSENKPAESDGDKESSSATSGSESSDESESEESEGESSSSKGESSEEETDESAEGGSAADSELSDGFSEETAEPNSENNSSAESASSSSDNNAEEDAVDEKSTIESVESEAELSEADYERILKELSEAIYDCEKAERENSSDEALPDVKLSSDGYKGVCRHAKCLVSKAPNPGAGADKTYSAILDLLGNGPAHLASQLNRIIHNDREEKIYRSSGAISVKRYASGRVTANLFSKRRDPANKSDAQVLLLIDESGSMWGQNKYVAACQAAIGLAEVFAKLHIPLTVIGFTADECGAAANHIHYLDEKNNHQARLRLLGIKARSDNFDGYSIRYATEILKKKSAERKILLVLSDGYPAAHAYRTTADGIMDTKLAIAEASKVAATFGILVGNENPQTHKEMYGYNFLHISKVSELFTGLAKLIKKEIMKW